MPSSLASPETVPSSTAMDAEEKNSVAVDLTTTPSDDDGAASASASAPAPAATTEKLSASRDIDATEVHPPPSSPPLTNIKRNGIPTDSTTTASKRQKRIRKSNIRDDNDYYNTPLNIEPCSLEQMRDHVTSLRREIEHAEARIDYWEGVQSSNQSSNQSSSVRRNASHQTSQGKERTTAQRTSANNHPTEVNSTGDKKVYPRGTVGGVTVRSALALLWDEELCPDRKEARLRGEDVTTNVSKRALFDTTHRWFVYHPDFVAAYEYKKYRCAMTLVAMAMDDEQWRLLLHSHMGAGGDTNDSANDNRIARGKEELFDAIQKRVMELIWEWEVEMKVKNEDKFRNYKPTLHSLGKRFLRIRKDWMTATGKEESAFNEVVKERMNEGGK
mmetsp:Transcript_542/g.1134  ORF Transcript_542/g.1134 Transcript_542/m.1134 type:complete len:387 (+) Transcript_542:71-1231(+)